MVVRIKSPWVRGPDLHLTFEGVDYTGAEIGPTVSANGSIVAGGGPIDMNVMEVISVATIHYLDHDAITEVYQPTAGLAADLFTFHPARTVRSSGERRLIRHPLPWRFRGLPR